MIIKKIKKEIYDLVGKDKYDNHFKPLRYEIDDRKLQLTVITPAEHIKMWLLSNKFDIKFKKILLKLTKKDYNIIFLLSDFKGEDKYKAIKKFSSHSLNSSYIFNSYVVGESNELAYHASLNTAMDPGKPAYNPLFIYGGVGLGKTHLLHSIGNKIMKEKEHIKVINMTSEEFMHEYSKAIKDKKTHELINRFRKNCDILLIDDIQFLSKWQGTQVQFFHVFNHLRDANKQIVITSDRTPQEISDIEERLRSRFEWGLVIEVGIPNLETRIEIINEKSKAYGLKISDELIKYLAQHLKTNIREIEGILKNILLISQHTKKEINLQLLEKILKDHMKFNQKNISIELIKKTVSKFYDLPTDDLDSKKRKKEITIPRQISMYLIKELTKNTYKEIGESFHRDHSTVLNSIKKIKEEIKNNIKIQKEIKEIKRMLI